MDRDLAMELRALASRLNLPLGVVLDAAARRLVSGRRSDAVAIAFPRQRGRPRPGDEEVRAHKLAVLRSKGGRRLR